MMRFLSALVAAGALAIPALLSGCTGCEPATTAPSDAGPLFTGIDAPGYGPRDAGTPPPEPCAGTVRRVRFGLGEESLDHVLSVWASGDRVLVELGGTTLRLFDLESEREIPVDALPEGHTIHTAFAVDDGFELLVSSGSDRSLSVRRIDRDGRLDAAEPAVLTLPVSAYARHIRRLSDAEYAGFGGVGPEGGIRPAIAFVVRPGAEARTIDLGLALGRFIDANLQVSDRLMFGVAHDEDRARIVRFEVDLDTESVRIVSLLDAAHLAPQPLGTSTRIEVAATGETAVAAVAHVPLDAPEEAIGVAELFWWQLRGEPITRQVLPGETELQVGLLGLAADMPRQTLVLQRSSSLRSWVTASRIRAPGEVVGGSSPIAIVEAPHSTAAWEPSPGTLGLALLSQRELDVIFVCEGAP